MRIERSGSRAILARLLRCLGRRGHESSAARDALQPGQADAFPLRPFAGLRATQCASRFAPLRRGTPERGKDARLPGADDRCRAAIPGLHVSRSWGVFFSIWDRHA